MDVTLPPGRRRPVTPRNPLPPAPAKQDSGTGHDNLEGTDQHGPQLPYLEPAQNPHKIVDAVAAGRVSLQLNEEG